MEHYPFMVDCLKEYNYPKIHTMDNKEITQIFSAANRQFLVTWILQQIDDTYGEVLQNITNEELAEIINCKGFCGANLKQRFITGELDSENQFVIIYKMFKHLKDTRVAKSLEAKRFSNEDVEECVKFNENLFPMYGAKQTLTAKQKGKKLLEYRQEIEELKVLMQASNTNTDLVAPLDPALLNQVSEIFTYFENNLLELTRKLYKLLKDDGAQTKQTDFGPEFATNLEACNNSLKTALQLIQSKNTIADFNSETKKEAICERGANKQMALVREIAELCHEINVLKMKP